MLYLLAFFISPLALLLAGKPIQALLNAVIYVLSFFGLFLIFLPGVALWAIGVVHAFVVINNKKADQRTEKIIRSMRK